MCVVVPATCRDDERSSREVRRQKHGSRLVRLADTQINQLMLSGRVQTGPGEVQTSPPVEVRDRYEAVVPRPVFWGPIHGSIFRHRKKRQKIGTNYMAETRCPETIQFLKSHFFVDMFLL